MASGITRPMSKTQPSTVVLKKCDNCSRIDEALLKCSKCKITYYCNATCQGARYSVHKVSCKTPDERTEAFDTQHKATAEFLKSTLSRSENPRDRELFETIKRIDAIEKEMDRLISKNPARDFYKKLAFNRYSNEEIQKLSEDFFDTHPDYKPDENEELDNRISALEDEKRKLLSSLNETYKPLIIELRRFSVAKNTTMQRMQGNDPLRDLSLQNHAKLMQALDLLGQNEDVEQILQDVSFGVPEQQLFIQLQRSWEKLPPNEAARRKNAWEKIAPFYGLLVSSFKELQLMTRLGGGDKLHN